MLNETILSRLSRDDVTRLVVALSGGMDSVCLLHSVMAADLGKQLCAIHVNHGLQPSAGDFADCCASLCRRWQVAFSVHPVEVSKVGNLESNARVARYAVFESMLTAGDLLLLAHHADDQVETVLFRLFRGSRVQGLQGMPMERSLGTGMLYRPLLNMPRRDIQTYAETHHLRWLDDATNLDTSFDRNWLRHRMIPMMEERWPSVKSAILNTLAQDQSRLGQLATEARETLAALSLTPDSLALAQLQTLDSPSFNRVLDAWFNDLGLPLLRGHLLRELKEKFLHSEGGFIVRSDIELRTYQGCLYALRPLPAPACLEEKLTSGPLPVAGGTVSRDLVQGTGLRADREYQMRLRSGGEKLKIRHNRRLKNLLQESRLPPWLRDRLPLIFHEDQLVAIAALPAWHLPMLLADHWTADSTQQGWQISLHLKDRLSPPPS